MSQFFASSGQSITVDYIGIQKGYVLVLQCRLIEGRGWIYGGKYSLNLFVQRVNAH